MAPSPLATRLLRIPSPRVHCTTQRAVPIPFSGGDWPQVILLLNSYPAWGWNPWESLEGRRRMVHTQQLGTVPVSGRQHSDTAPFSNLKILSAFLRGEQRCGAAREPPIPSRSSHVGSSGKRFAGVCYTPFFFFFFRFLCSIYVYMCMCIHVCIMCMHMHVKTRGQPQRSFQGLCSLFSKLGSLTGLRSH